LVYLTLSEEHTQRVFENTVLRKVFWPKRDGNWGVEEIA
jgi:hypothetical protein